MAYILRYPNATLAKTPSTLSGDHASVDESPDSPDGAWLGKAVASIEFVGSSSYTVTDDPGNVSSFQISKPAGVQENDLILFIIGYAAGAGTVVDESTTFTKDVVYIDGSLDVAIHAYKRVATASEAASYTFDILDDLGDPVICNCCCICVAYRHAEIDPNVTPAGAIGIVVGTTMTAPSLTPSTSNEWLLAAFVTDAGEDSSGISPPTNMTERLECGNIGQLNVGKPRAQLSEQVLSSTSATGARSTETGVATPTMWAAMSLLLRPA